MLERKHTHEQISHRLLSGTGNTETMANCIAEGAREAGAEVALMGPRRILGCGLTEYQVVAFGCPAMGAEQLEEDEVEPMFSGLEGSLGSKKDRPVRLLRLGRRTVDAGTGAPERRAAGADLYDEEGLIANESPNEEAREACRDLGRSLAAW